MFGIPRFLPRLRNASRVAEGWQCLIAFASPSTSEVNLMLSECKDTDREEVNANLARSLVPLHKILIRCLICSPLTMGQRNEPMRWAQRQLVMVIR